MFPTRCKVTQFICIWKMLYMFRVVLPHIIRSAYNCTYSIWYLSHRYCYLLLSWKSWNWFECAVGGVRLSHAFHTSRPPHPSCLDQPNTTSCSVQITNLLIMQIHLSSLAPQLTPISSALYYEAPSHCSYPSENRRNSLHL
jgi:hypothetical protein